jgi:hypothetical protein
VCTNCLPDSTMPATPRLDADLPVGPEADLAGVVTTDRDHRPVGVVEWNVAARVGSSPTRRLAGPRIERVRSKPLTQTHDSSPPRWHFL